MCVDKVLHFFEAYLHTTNRYIKGNPYHPHRPLGKGKCPHCGTVITFSQWDWDMGVTILCTNEECVFKQGVNVYRNRCRVELLLDIEMPMKSVDEDFL